MELLQNAGEIFASLAAHPFIFGCAAVLFVALRIVARKER